MMMTTIKLMTTMIIKIMMMTTMTMMDLIEVQPVNKNKTKQKATKTHNCAVNLP